MSGEPATALGIGSYSSAEAARLLRTSPVNVRRWLSGYTYKQDGKYFEMPPLWTPQLPRSDSDDHLEIGFRDLIELRFVKAFVEQGVGLKAIRNCLEYARQVVNDAHPFSTRRFQTDGKTIFLEGLEKTSESEPLDLKRRQYVLREIIAKTFKDLDIHENAVTRWRPFRGRASIVIDPTRAFGQPIATRYGVPTIALSDAVDAEGSPDRVSRIFEVPLSVVREAVNFENMLRAA